MIQNISCDKCNCKMHKKTVAKNSQGTSIFIILIGLCLSLFMPIVGIPCFLIGLVMGCGTKQIIICDNCGNFYKSYK